MQDGIRPQCKECRKKESKHYYVNNKEKISIKAKIYRQDNKELCNIRIERWAKKDIFRYWASVAKKIINQNI